MIGPPKTIDVVPILTSMNGAGLAPLLATANAVPMVKCSIRRPVRPMGNVVLEYAWRSQELVLSAWMMDKAAALIQIAVPDFVLEESANL